MKSKGELIIRPFVIQMKENQKAWINPVDLIIFRNKDLKVQYFLNIYSTTNKTKDHQDGYTTLIERIGPKDDDFMIDFNTYIVFKPLYLTIDQIESYKNDERFVGPDYCEFETYNENNHYTYIEERADLENIIYEILLIRQNLYQVEENQKDYIAELEDEIAKYTEITLKKVQLMTIDQIQEKMHLFESNAMQSLKILIERILDDKITSCNNNQIYTSWTMEALDKEIEKAKVKQDYERCDELNKIREEKRSKNGNHCAGYLPVLFFDSKKNCTKYSIYDNQTNLTILILQNFG